MMAPAATINGPEIGIHCHYMDHHGLTAFDAYHIAYAWHDSNISSDTAFDEVADERISIEETPPE